MLRISWQRLLFQDLVWRRYFKTWISSNIDSWVHNPSIFDESYLRLMNFIVKSSTVFVLYYIQPHANAVPERRCQLSYVLPIKNLSAVGNEWMNERTNEWFRPEIIIAPLQQQLLIPESGNGCSAAALKARYHSSEIAAYFLLSSCQGTSCLLPLLQPGAESRDSIIQRIHDLISRNRDECIFIKALSQDWFARAARLNHRGFSSCPRNFRIRAWYGCCFFIFRVCVFVHPRPKLG